MTCGAGIDTCIGACVGGWPCAVVLVRPIMAIIVVPSVKPVIVAAPVSSSLVVVVPVPPASSIVALVPVAMSVPPPISIVVPVAPVPPVPVSLRVFVVPDLVPPSVSPDPPVGPHSLVSVVVPGPVDSGGGPPVVDGLSDGGGCGSGGRGGDSPGLSIVGERVRGGDSELIFEFVLAVPLETLVV